ncbi:protein AF-10 isoform X4 [Denticeps clupeoides]|uniref:protein AF-10 isoform X4 n=1 Tax=Denticeps clupeoides TaxID=299321 RepID=UPI0010A343BF|nr:protein AF-10 isoform X4 [Denticeps clupeoides]
MVSSGPRLAAEDDRLASNMKEMIGGCCVCSDERGWAENPLVYCDGHGCNVAVHQACYGIVQVPTGPWFCRKCESQERAARVIKGWKGRKPNRQTPDGGGVFGTRQKDEEDEALGRSLKSVNTLRCELCPHKDGALKRTDNGGWAHVVCALYIPEVEFANVSTMEPIVLQSVPHERYNKTCYICEEQGRESKAASGACMTCNKHGCRQAFHVTCAQFAGLLCEEQGSDADNVKYCGYCKYHYSKLRRSKGHGSRAQSLSDSSSHSLDKHHDKDKKKHKERERHKPKHKKTLDLSPSLVPGLMVSSEKNYNSSSGSSISSMPASAKRQDDGSARFTNANFQEVPTHTGGGTKDCMAGEGKGSEGKIRKTNSHCSSQRGRKSTSGKPLGAVVTTTASSSTASSSPFQQGLLLGSGSIKTASSSSVVQPTSDFLSFSEASLRNADSYTPSAFGRSLVKPGGEGVASEGMSLNTFGSLMSLTPNSTSLSGKHYENSYPSSEQGTLSSAGFKRSQPSSSSSSAASSSSTGEDGVKGKKKRGNWRNRYGPCFTTQDRKTPEASEHVAAALPSSTSASPSALGSLAGRGGAVSSSSAGGGGGGGGGGGMGMQKSPSLLRNGSLQSMGISSPSSGQGAFSNSDVAGQISSAVSGGTLPLSNSELPQQQATIPSLSSTPQLPPPAPFAAAASTTSTPATHVNSLSAPTFNLAPSHMFGNRLNPNSAMAALIAQSEATSTDQELGDGANSFPRRGASPKANLSPRSPTASGLHIRYDAPGSGVLGLGSGGPDTLPPVATSLEQLLERQWNEGQQFLMQHGAQGDVLGMLKSLHQLQVENRRLEEQIKTLTMKKERLQLLSAQLSVPFTPTSTAAALSATASSPQIQHGSTHTDLLNSSKVLSDSAQPVPAQDSVSGGHSSSGSTSSLSTPPSVAHSPPQQPVNGVSVAGMTMHSGSASSTIPTVAGVPGLMGALQGSQLAMSGIVGALNGVIQTPPSLTQNSSPLQHPSVVTSMSLPISSSLNSSSSATVKTSAARLELISEQQRQLLLQQQQLQQLFSPQQPTTQEQQQQVLLYQLMQQQQQQQHDLQQFQQLSSTQLPINSLLPSAQGAIAANPFLAVHADTGPQKTARLTEKAVSVAGQEKT